MTQKLRAEGATIAEALIEIAQKEGKNISDYEYKVEREQFFSENGQAIGLERFSVLAWEKQRVEGVQEMEQWLAKTLEVMGFTAEVSSSDRINAEGVKAVRFNINSEEGGRIIGRKGSTLGSIQQMMEETVIAKGFDWGFSINVSGGHKKERRERDSRDDRRNRRDRGDRGDRRSNKRDEQKLQQLAAKLAQRVVKTGEELVIEKELNGFQRRVVHLTVQEIEGVKSESFMDEDVKKIKLIPDTTEG